MTVTRAVPGYIPSVPRLKPVTKQLTCPYCGDVIGDVRYRPLAGWLRIKWAQLPP
jgi:hypothetical protein